jgi:hypothetical protein
MSMGKACIVTKDASFEDIHDDCAIKIGLGPREVGDLTRALDRLMSDGAFREALGGGIRQCSSAGIERAVQERRRK